MNNGIGETTYDIYEIRDKGNVKSINRRRTPKSGRIPELKNSENKQFT